MATRPAPARVARSLALAAAALLAPARLAASAVGVQRGLVRASPRCPASRVRARMSDEPAGAFDGAELGGGGAPAAPPLFEVGQAVSLDVINFSPLGCNVRVDGVAEGLVYSSELAYPPRVGNLGGLPLRRGDLVGGYVATVREDGKLDISLRKHGFAKAEGARATLLLALLAAPGRELPLGDASPPEAVSEALGLSKAQFKQAAGALWKAGVIDRPADQRIALKDGGGASPAAAAAGAETEAARVVFVQGLPYDASARELIELVYAHAPTSPGAPPPSGVRDGWLVGVRGLEQPDGRHSGRAWLLLGAAEDAAALLQAAPGFLRPGEEAAEGGADGAGAAGGGLAEMNGRALRWCALGARPSRQAWRQHALPNLGQQLREQQQGGGGGARGDGGGGGGVTLFVANLPFDASETEVRNLFDACGALLDVRLPLGDDGRPRGFAHVTFADEAGAERALAYSGRRFAGREVRIERSRGGTSQRRGRPPGGGGGARRGPPRGGDQRGGRGDGRGGRDGGARGPRGGEAYVDRRTRAQRADGAPSYRVVKFATSDFDVRPE